MNANANQPPRRKTGGARVVRGTPANLRLHNTGEITCTHDSNKPQTTATRDPEMPELNPEAVSTYLASIQGDEDGLIGSIQEYMADYREFICKELGEDEGSEEAIDRRPNQVGDRSTHREANQGEEAAQEDPHPPGPVHKKKTRRAGRKRNGGQRRGLGRLPKTRRAPE